MGILKLLYVKQLFNVTITNITQVIGKTTFTVNLLIQQYILFHVTDLCTNECPIRTYAKSCLYWLRHIWHVKKMCTLELPGLPFSLWRLWPVWTWRIIPKLCRCCPVFSVSTSLRSEQESTEDAEGLNRLFLQPHTTSSCSYLLPKLSGSSLRTPFVIRPTLPRILADPCLGPIASCAWINVWHWTRLQMPWVFPSSHYSSWHQVSLR